MPVPDEGILEILLGLTTEDMRAARIQLGMKLQDAASRAELNAEV